MFKHLFLSLICTLLFSSYYAETVDDQRDSIIQAISELDISRTQGKIPQKEYLDSIHLIMKNCLAANVLFTNQELLNALSGFRKTAWESQGLEEYKRTYYGILCNNAEMADREGEMLYYLKKINDIEEKGTSRPSVTALSLLTQYYNSKNSYNKTKELFASNKEFILGLPDMLEKKEYDMKQTVQSVMFLYNIADAFYQLKDTLNGYETEKNMTRIAEFAFDQASTSTEAIANIKLRQGLATYRRGMSKDDTTIILQSFQTFEQLIRDDNTPGYLVRPLTANLTEYKIVYFIRTQQSDSVAHYIKIYDSIHPFKNIPYNLFILQKHKGEALYMSGDYKASADTLMAAILNLDLSRANIVRDIDDMMYARAEADEKHILLTETEKSKQNSEKWMYISFIFITAILVSASFLFIYFRQRHRAKFLEFKLNMARNIHDETCPALLYAMALAKSNRIENSDQKNELEAHIEDTIDVIRSLSHDLKSDKNHTLGELVLHAENTFRKLHIDNNCYHIDDHMDESRFISHYQYRHLKAIMNECITNTIKHAEFENIKIQFIQAGNRLTVRYNDDGKGMMPGEATTGIGMNNMRERVKKINGEFQLDNHYPDGYHIIISFLLR